MGMSKSLHLDEKIETFSPIVLHFGTESDSNLGGEIFCSKILKNRISILEVDKVVLLVLIY